MRRLTDDLSDDVKRRLPPGQFVSKKWPVLHAGSVPACDEHSWTFSVDGLVDQPFTLSYADFRQLPAATITADIHCVTRWSKLDMQWTGVPVRAVLDHAWPSHHAGFVVVHCEGSFTTNLPLEALYDDDVLLSWRADGQDLSPEHGWPLRLVIPKRYFWKSAKWVRRLEVVAADQPGFWERLGYHNDAFPWQEQRYQKARWW
ncbi:MAG: sulfite oxidase-like oxidoreductase [Chloroflexi bacterium]|nr:sulfite oxidase-like oxidoreductase [Chloroflexota bacterium]